MRASYFNYPKIVKELLKDPNIDVNIQNFNQKNTALILASKVGRIDVIKILLDHHNINWSLKNNDGKVFFDYLKGDEINKTIKYYPEIYKKYLFNKKIDDYNL